ncbi:MAG TPA: SH3 domain-containing protein, partial [Pyrinomonadaceae bacterium]
AGGAPGPAETDGRGYRGEDGSRGFTAAPPPAPTFDRESRAPGNHSSRHRFVVPIARDGGPAAAVTPAEFESDQFLAPRAGVDVPAGTFTPPRARGDGGASGVSSRLRRWGVALLLLLAFSGMLYATYVYVRGARGAGAGWQQQPQQQGAAGNKTGIAGSEFVTTTDVNLRKGPDPSYTIIGLAENGSRVRVLQVSGRWYQVRVIEHKRPKADPDSSDEGWVNSINLRKS